MDERTFYQGLGFKSNPFRYTNADEEVNLPEYFIPPPYFDSVWGNPEEPTSTVVFAPRGGGKSAQRRMIEIKSSDSDVLAIQYSRFEFQRGQSLSDCDLEYHLMNINRIALIAFLMLIDQKGLYHLNFTGTERKQIQALSKFYLYDLNTEAIINAANAVMSPVDKAKHFFERNLWAINSIIDTIFSKVGIKSVRDAAAMPGLTTRPSKNHLEIIASLIKSLGLHSIYILVDKVDETQLTGNDSKASFELIEALIRDLELLQMDGIAIKFFLWNELYPFYKKYARPDRIPQFNLQWTSEELKEMMKKRLLAHSYKDKILNFYDLLNIDDDLKNLVEDLVVTFSHGSPRDMIRICQQMVSEQLRLSGETLGISALAVSNGLNIFCEQRAREVVQDHILDELRKTRRLDFTVNYIASDIFKIGTNGARSKIKNWLKTGTVKHIDDIQVQKSKRPSHQYAVIDSRVAKSIFPDLGFIPFITEKVRWCLKCKSPVLRDWDISKTQRCQACKTRWTSK
jgi:hypothetical protein